MKQEGKNVGRNKGNIRVIKGVGKWKQTVDSVLFNRKTNDRKWTAWKIESCDTTSTVTAFSNAEGKQNIGFK